MNARASIVCLSVLAATGVAGAPAAGAAHTSAAAVGPTQRLLSPGDGVEGDSFGYAVALRGGTALVGAPRHWVEGRPLQGAAYVFEHGTGGWSQTAELMASDGADSDAFGTAVALSATLAAVGAPDHTVRGHPGQGAVYLFAPSGSGGWTQVAELSASDGAASDGFGGAVAISGSTVLVGASGHSVQGRPLAGAAYVFSLAGGAWSQAAELTASDPAAFDEFGNAVGVSGSTALVGAPGHALGSRFGQGEAYAFTRSNGRWSQTGTLVASDGEAYDAFAESIALSGDTAVLGAPAQADYRGGAYVFTRSGGGWSQAAELTPPDGRSFDEFGGRVAIEPGTVLVGSHAHSPPGTHSGSGAAYVFAATGSGGWTETAELADAHAQPDELFGESVALAGRRALVGAVSRSVRGNGGAGAAFVFRPV
jgi:hypothetical protein